MLYKKKDTKKMDPELFENPTSEYRAAPFWAWNCKLNQTELERQIEVFKKMGFGGAHMHVRTGMDTPYLSDEFMEHIKGCVAKSKSEGMLSWLYDEDRWPSGAAGGIVTRDTRYRARHLLFTLFPYGSDEADLREVIAESAKSGRTENGKLLACYDVELDKNGLLIRGRVIKEDEPAKHEKWYAYLETNTPSPWFNNQTYVNTLDPEAMRRFIDVTYESYLRAVGDEFGKTIPAIFTDEPQFATKSTLKFAFGKDDVILPWTDDLTNTYAAAYGGEDLLANLPELIWDRADGAASVIRYHYHDHVCERFTRAFVDQCGSWCDDHGLALTGHMMAEPTLRSQTSCIGEAMRGYRSMAIPGIDMLAARFEYTTAKQAQSAVRQYGREGMMSELYGVTGWDFDFRGHKLHGDWQAALGVTLRVPHLAWVSMEGEAKRDYPASIGYQSPWHERYSLVEDHFARLNVALTRGKPIVRVGVIHPIESYWLHWGPEESTQAERRDMDENFKNITEWLLFGGIDFDFISESLLPELCGKEDFGKNTLKVGEMEYAAVIVPGCETIRSSTLDRLEGFADAGGRLIFMGRVPNLVDAIKSDRAAMLAARCTRIPFSRAALLEGLKEERLIEMRTDDGILTDDLLCQMRADGDGRWLFIAHGKEPYNKQISNFNDVRIRIKGNWHVTVYDTLSGRTKDIWQERTGGFTQVRRRMYDYDSLLMKLTPADENAGTSYEKPKRTPADPARGIFSYGGPKSLLGYGKLKELPMTVPYTLDEPNALILDYAEYALDDEDWQPREEILKVDDRCRKKLGWPGRKERVAQPYTVKPERITHFLRLRFHVISEVETDGAMLAIEDASALRLYWNGNEISNEPCGWYADKSIRTVRLPKIKAGENVLEAVIPFGRRTAAERAYILGDFGVEVAGRMTRIVSKKDEIAFGDITRQGLAFYGGNITYRVPITTAGGSLIVCSGHYEGAMQEVRADEGAPIPMIYPPYTATLGRLSPGRHLLCFTLYGHRANAFGPVHLADGKLRYVTPAGWRTEGDKWCDEYMLKEIGILSAPDIREI